MAKTSKKPEKSIGRPRLKPCCKYVMVNLNIPAWMAADLSAVFLKEGKSSRNKLIEGILAGFLGYENKTYIKKCEDEARKESRKRS